MTNEVQVIKNKIKLCNNKIDSYSCYTGRFILYYGQIWDTITYFLRKYSSRTFYEWVDSFILMIIRVCYLTVCSIFGIVSDESKGWLRYFTEQREIHLKELEKLLTNAKEIK